MPSYQSQKSAKRFGLWSILLGITAIIVLVAIPLIIVRDGSFSGSDNLGAETITLMAPEYDSGWITNWWAPPSTETESALFALQAAFGGVLIGYFFGYMHGRKKTGLELQNGRHSPD